jgi:tetratricopeptide (TPR) repeat protein
MVSPSSRKDLGIAVLLALAVFAVYFQVRGFTFVSYDDPAYLTENLQVRGGLTWASLQWAFTTFDIANWHPLTWVSFLCDVSLFGIRPGGHHLVNVAFHIANSILCFFLLRALTGSRWRSALVAALFALHPSHVESVAWISERKDVLSTLFWFLTTFAYLAWVRRPSRRRYGLMAMLFALGLLAKPMLVTLPLTLLLLDLWPLERVQSLGDAVARLREKAPLFLMVVALSMVTLLAQSNGGAMSSFDKLPMAPRLANAFQAVVRYLGLALWPTNLSAFYPFQHGAPQFWKSVAAGAILAALSVIALLQARKRPYLIVGWAWFLITLVPVIGIIQVGSQAMADRYTYLPFLGLFIIFAWGLAEVVQRLALPPWVPAAGATLWLGVLMFLTARQVSTWRNTYTLFGHARQVSQNTPLACMAMGHALIEDGRLADAVQEYRNALRMAPDFTPIVYSLGRTLVRMGNGEEALKIYRDLLARHPAETAAHFFLAQGLEEMGKDEEAIKEYRQIENTDPQRLGRGARGLDMAFATHLKLGQLLWAKRDFAAAAPQFQEATRRMPLGPDPRSHVANDYAARSLLVLGKAGEAADLWQRSLAMNSRQPQIWFSLGLALGQTGQRRASAEAFRQALALDPTYTAAQRQLAIIEGKKP